MLLQKLGFTHVKNNGFDSSSGTVEATYTEPILRGIFNFTAEGMVDTIPVISKKVGNDFIRGSGSSATVLFDENSPLAVFRKTECVE